MAKSSFICLLALVLQVTCAVAAPKDQGRPVTQISDGQIQSPTGRSQDQGSNSADTHVSKTQSWSASTSSPALVNPIESSTLSSVQVQPECTASMDGQLPTYTPASFEFSGNIRQFYVAAEEVEWDYAPTGWDNWLGVPLSDSPRAKMAGILRSGTIFTKALYRGYTDATFSKQTDQSPFQGTQGPTLRAEVGDMIEIMFINNLQNFYATMHSMGLAYGKGSEGADYPNATSVNINATIPEENAVPPVQKGVAPGGCVVYKWLVTDNAGPAKGIPAKTHSYHSYVSLYHDSAAGLIGPTIVYAKGMMESTMASHREIPLLYMIYDENVSFLSGVNAQKLTGQNYTLDVPQIYSSNQSIWYPQVTNIAGSSQFSGAPKFHTMNGYVFANNPTFQMCLNDKVIWYVNAYGSASHIFHMHGNGFKYENISQYAISINDGVGKTLYMDATGPGLWQVICHVDNHQAKGMVANYKVFQNNCPLPSLSS
ncbi:Cupredoxin [Aureobasidium subglaciale]|nr:Cupredoxin [Aureobasidium subglaciale]